MIGVPIRVMSMPSPTQPSCRTSLERVNPGSRRDAKATEWVYAHYVSHLREKMDACDDVVHTLVEFLLNIVLIRNTLSYLVRSAIRAGSFVWLKLDASSRVILNLADLHKFAWRSYTDIFGTYVNPMRRRSEIPEQGYVELLIEVDLFLASGVRIMDFFWQCKDVGALLQALMGIKGYGGSGFRSKELLCDFLDHMYLFLSGGELNEVMQAYRQVTVIGVGPCRTTNYLFNRQFFLNERAPSKKKWEIYFPLLKFIADCLRAGWPDRYEHRTNLDIFYELCEYQKQLFTWYEDGGKVYTCAKYLESQDLFGPTPSVPMAKYIESIERAVYVQRGMRAKKKCGRSATPFEEGDDDQSTSDSDSSEC
jgi:hypothetical protein